MKLLTVLGTVLICSCSVTLITGDNNDITENIREGLIVVEVDDVQE